MPTTERGVRISTSGVVNGLRGIIRQLAAAVYVYIAYGIGLRLVGPHRFTWALEPVFVLIGSALSASLTEGRRWTAIFVGLFVAIFDGVLQIVVRGESLRVSLFTRPATLIIIVASVIGAWLGGLRRRRMNAA